MELGAQLARRLDRGDSVSVPDHLRELFDYLYDGHEDQADADAPPADS
jgi:hypothetical protein